MNLLSVNNFIRLQMKHGKSYRRPNEESFRRSIFRKNMLLIEEHNKKFSAGLVSYNMEMNHFGDMVKIPEHECFIINYYAS